MPTRLDAPSTLAHSSASSWACQRVADRMLVILSTRTQVLRTRRLTLIGRTAHTTRHVSVYAHPGPARTGCLPLHVPGRAVGVNQPA